ncbi:hypothetical protein QE405_001188 [Nocardioides zeae]|uniref:Uncharacterized protein n=1 Tax=Nocardioides zeae TaxID=1457234 RepID=A0AAJ1TY54_9ACTN|nr:hypothetical protein [Nocardioides zeae]MDQ1103904.1 hypothetical protein [Nocardioides zeae]
MRPAPGGDLHAARLRAVASGSEPHEGGLAGARRTEHGDVLAGAHLEGHVADADGRAASPAAVGTSRGTPGPGDPCPGENRLPRRERHRASRRPRIRRRGPGALVHATVREAHDAVAQDGGHTRVVRDEQQRRTAGVEGAPQRGHDLGGGHRVEGRGRLVGDEEVGLGEEREREGHALPLAAREHGRVPSSHGRVEAELVEHRDHRAPRRAPVRGAGAGHEPELTAHRAPGVERGRGLLREQPRPSADRDRALEPQVGGRR